MTSYLRPPTLAAALAAYGDHPSFTVIAGCTDFMVGAGDRPAPAGLIDIFGLSDLVGITVGDGTIRIGAATPYAAIRAHEAVLRSLPCLHQCVTDIGAGQIQERGTIGGNVATSSPVGDTLPVLLALNASIHVASCHGERSIPYDDFCTGYRQTACARDELIVDIEIPIPRAGTRQYWRKVGTRQAQSISKVSVAATARLGTDGTIEACRLAMGAVAALPIRLPAVEAALLGNRPDEALAERARENVAAAISPIDDVRSSAFYRRMVAANLTRRFILSLAG